MVGMMKEVQGQRFGAERRIDQFPGPSHVLPTEEGVVAALHCTNQDAAQLIEQFDLGME